MHRSNGTFRITVLLGGFIGLFEFLSSNNVRHN